MYHYDGYYPGGVHIVLGLICIGTDSLSLEKRALLALMNNSFAHLVKSVDSLHHLKFELSKLNSLFLCGVMAITN